MPTICCALFCYGLAIIQGGFCKIKLLRISRWLHWHLCQLVHWKSIKYLLARAQQKKHNKVRTVCRLNVYCIPTRVSCWSIIMKGIWSNIDINFFIYIFRFSVQVLIRLMTMTHAIIDFTHKAVSLTICAVKLTPGHHNMAPRNSFANWPINCFTPGQRWHQMAW